MSTSESITFAVSALAVAAVCAVTGVYAVRTLTLALEGHYEFKGDSLTRRTRLGGFVRAGLWATVVVLAWSFFIDWYWFQDVGFAFAALMVRLEVVLHILAELGDN